jgi:hypothetical protein
VWERFDTDTKQLDADLIVAQVEKTPIPTDARERLGECAVLADKIVRLTGSSAAKSALGDRLASLNSKINNLQGVSFINTVINRCQIYVTKKMVLIKYVSTI